MGQLTEFICSLGVIVVNYGRHRLMVGAVLKLFKQRFSRRLEQYTAGGQQRKQISGLLKFSVFAQGMQDMCETRQAGEYTHVADCRTAPKAQSATGGWASARPAHFATRSQITCFEARARWPVMYGELAGDRAAEQSNSDGRKGCTSFH